MIYLRIAAIVLLTIGSGFLVLSTFFHLHDSKITNAAFSVAFCILTGAIAFQLLKEIP